METVFTPYAALGGGALLGLASVLLMAFFGRIFGATGIMVGLFAPGSRSDWVWRVAILAGMVSGPAVIFGLSGAWPTIQVPVSMPMLLIGGFVVGIGVTYGSGCSSGHGICGIARLSPRSIVATLAFMTTTAMTVYVIRHIIGA